MFLACLSGAAQEKRDSLKLAPGTRKLVPDSLTVKEYSNDYLDTVKIEKKFILNDYSSIGIEFLHEIPQQAIRIHAVFRV